MVYPDEKKVETYCKAPRPLVSKVSPTITAPSEKSKHADDQVQTCVGTHDDDEETAVHDAWAQVETGCSSHHISCPVPWSQFASEKERKNSKCTVSRTVDTQKENKAKATTSNIEKTQETAKKEEAKASQETTTT